MGEESAVSKRAVIEAAIRRLAPLIPDHELSAVVDQAVDSPGLRAAAPEAAAWLSLVAYARHVFTDYDDLLREGYDAESARFFTTEAINTTLQQWGVKRRLTGAQ